MALLGNHRAALRFTRDSGCRTVPQAIGPCPGLCATQAERPMNVPVQLRMPFNTEGAIT